MNQGFEGVGIRGVKRGGSHTSIHLPTNRRNKVRETTTRELRGGSRNSSMGGGGGGSGPEFFEGGGVRVQVRGIFIY